MTVDATELHFSHLSVTHFIRAEKEPDCWRMERLKDSPEWGIEYFYQLMLRWHTKEIFFFFLRCVFWYLLYFEVEEKMIYMYDKRRAKASLIFCSLQHDHHFVSKLKGLLIQGQHFIALTTVTSLLAAFFVQFRNFFSILYVFHVG